MKKIIGILLGMLGGAVVGVVIALANFNVPEYAFSFGNLVLVLLSFVLFFLLAVVVHETGHLVCGLATGYKFSQFRLFSFVWTKKNGKIRFAYSKSFVAGQCLMEPPKDYVDFKYKLYNLGGGLFNIAFGLILLGIWLLLPGVGFLLVGAVLNIVLGLLNLIPLNLEVPNDGMNIRTAAKSDIASQGFHLMLKVSHEMTEGKRFRDFVPELFALPNGADLGNYFVAYFVMLEAARLEDLGEYDAMAGQLRRLKDVKLPAYYHNSIRQDMLVYYIIHNPDYDKARRLYTKKAMQKFLQMPLPNCAIARTAYTYFVLDDKENGAKLLAKAKALTESYPNEGHRLIWMNDLARLEELMLDNAQDT